MTGTIVGPLGPISGFKSCAEIAVIYQYLRKGEVEDSLLGLYRKQLEGIKTSASERRRYDKKTVDYCTLLLQTIDERLKPGSSENPSGPNQGHYALRDMRTIDGHVVVNQSEAHHVDIGMLIEVETYSAPSRESRNRYSIQLPGRRFVNLRIYEKPEKGCLVKIDDDTCIPRPDKVFEGHVYGGVRTCGSRRR